MAGAASMAATPVPSATVTRRDPDPAGQPRHHERHDRDRAGRHHEVPRPGQEPAVVAPQEVRPGNLGGDRERQHPAAPAVRPVGPPEHDDPGARQRGERRRQRGHVGGVRDHAHLAEDQAERGQPGTPHHEPAADLPGGLGPAAPAGPRQAEDEGEQREGVQPADLRAVLAAKQLGPAGPEAAAAGGRRRRGPPAAA